MHNKYIKNKYRKNNDNKMIRIIVKVMSFYHLHRMTWMSSITKTEPTGKRTCLNMSYNYCKVIGWYSNSISIKGNKSSQGDCKSQNMAVKPLTNNSRTVRIVTTKVKWNKRMVTLPVFVVILLFAHYTIELHYHKQYRHYHCVKLIVSAVIANNLH